MKQSMTPAKAGAASAAIDMDLGAMHGPGTSVRSGPRTADIADLGGRAIVIVLFTLMAIRIGSDFLATGRLTGLLLLASETLVVVLTVMRRSAATIDRSYHARIVTALALLGPLVAKPASVAVVAPEALTVLVSAVGFSIVIAGKLSLGRSFGLMPANRGVVSGGLYRLVRHPIYMGYLLTHFGFLAAHPTGWNLVMLVGGDIALMWRAVLEERTLAKDAAYQSYAQVVRWRVLPGVF
ncbi:MAG: methyltransferase family protein [Vicinamibacterales bacterium]